MPWKYEHPTTGDLWDADDVEEVEVVDASDIVEQRNATPRDHRGSGLGRVLLAHRRSGDRQRPDRRPGGRPLIMRDRGDRRPRPRPGPDRDDIEDQGDFIAVRKGAVAELIPVAGQLWASFLGRPEAPQAVGDDIVDRNNASMHREALALHQQNQTRILALTDLAARAVKLFT